LPIKDKIIQLRSCNTVTIALQTTINQRNELLKEIKQNNIDNLQSETNYNVLEEQLNDEYSSINIINKTNERMNIKLINLNNKLSNIIIDNRNNNDLISKLELENNFKEIEIEDIYNNQIYKLGQDISILDRKLSTTSASNLANSNELIIQKERKYKQYTDQNDILLTNESAIMNIKSNLMSKITLITTLQGFDIYLSKSIYLNLSIYIYLSNDLTISI
jgi:hypothetical protein